MPHVANQYDIDFYNLVHALRVESSSNKSERRKRARKPYSCAQRISPIRVEGERRIHSPFFMVPCCDLNQGGFSFLLPHPPDFRELVVALGEPPQEIVMLAAVAHWHQVEQRQGKKRTPRAFHVGCRFMRRLGP
jgi:hypothetical protein